MLWVTSRRSQLVLEWQATSTSQCVNKHAWPSHMGRVYWALSEAGSKQAHHTSIIPWSECMLLSGWGLQKWISFPICGPLWIGRELYLLPDTYSNAVIDLYIVCILCVACSGQHFNRGQTLRVSIWNLCAWVFLVQDFFDCFLLINSLRPSSATWVQL